MAERGKAPAARTVLVTGGSRGLGLAIAQKLASGGDRVVAVARSRSCSFSLKFLRPADKSFE